MGMLLRRRLDDVKAKGATTLEAVAPSPSHDIEVEVKPKKPEKEVVKEKKPAKKVSRVDIMRMNVAAVRAYAEEQGIEGASAMSGAELKRILVNKMFDEESE